MVVVLQVLTNDFFWRAYSDSYVEPTVNLIMCHFFRYHTEKEEEEEKKGEGGGEWDEGDAGRRQR